MAAGAFGTRRAWAGVLGGLAWAQACIAVRLAVLPNYLALGELVADGPWCRIASWTLLAPVTLASRIVPAPATAGPGAAASELSLTALLLCSAIGVGLCLSALRALASPRRRRFAACILAVAGLLGALGGTAVALQFRDVVLAEKTFFAMLSSVDVPHKDVATVSAARAFVQSHPDSRWVGEALRIVAMAEWDAGRVQAASELWDRFASRFRDPSAPGVAYAEYNRALCEERLGNDPAARDHLRAAVEIIRARGDGIQGWIAPSAAERLSLIERSEGRYALADYWKTKSQTFADVYTTE